MTHDPSAARAASGPGGELPPGPSSIPALDADTSTDAGAGAPGPGSAGDAPLPTELSGAARRLFGTRLDLAAAYAGLLATDGVVRGLVGPREAPRIWDRHLLNCAAVAELIPDGATVLDVGSGAGLPGLVLAIARPDLSVVLVEPLARRTAFLDEAVTRLGLRRSVTVVRARAEEYLAGDPHARPLGDVVTARAVAPLDRLAGWCLPLARVGGRLLALKGASAEDEITEHRDAVERLGGGEPVVRRCGIEVIDPPTTVVEVVRERAVPPPGGKAARRSARPARDDGATEARRKGSRRRR
ncbi:16S rRNA (guanine(527)-N(7))-methyltransferase RsmG [Micromonospora sp. NPDC049559]|uniref:16S rRNA (guanine(527)-N(7))-methyltransferase RsmG n=1 Tax=Micromonospora sp. NPDC049559 TaxID=3155923 RepID=UPI003437DDFB